MEKKSNHFSGQIGFVLAAACSAVGVGNLWRFPYLAAKDGGGLFLIIYLALVLTFGFTLLVSDIAIGRRTKKKRHRRVHRNASKMEISGYSDIYRSGFDHDILCSYRRVDHQIRGGLSDRKRESGGRRRLFQFVYQFSGVAGSIRSPFYGSDCGDRL